MLSETIGDRILLVIEANNLKKVEFARVLNINQSYVTQLIKGRNQPSDRLIEDICQKYNINEEWLKTGEGEMRRATSPLFLRDSSLDATDREIIESYIRMTPTQRQFIKDWIRSIADTMSANTTESATPPSEPAANQQRTMTDDEIEADVAAYRAELLAEKEAALASSSTAAAKMA
nr:MAG TPA: helix-turn-helix domain protein [Caudoviricetes sp.]